MNADGQSRRIGWRTVWFRLLLITCGAFAAFGSSLRGDFVWLDHSEIVDGDYRVQNMSDFVEVWQQPLDRYMFREQGDVPVAGGYWRPLYAMGISLDWTLWRQKAWLYHLENVLWHAGLCIVLFFIGLRLVGNDPIARHAVFWGSLLFAVHPMGLQSVTWISGRKDIQCAFFGSCAILCFLKANASARVSWKLVVLGGLSQLAALGFKELAAVVPLFVTLAYLLKFGRTDSKQGREHSRRFESSTSNEAGQATIQREPRYAWKRLVMLASLWLITMAWLYQRSIVCGGFGLNATYPSETLLGNLATSVRVWFDYAQSLLIPIEPRLSDRWRISDSIETEEAIAMSAAGLGLAAIGYAMIRRRRWLPFTVWTVIWLLPASGIVPLRHFYAERYLYPASWGFLVLVAWIVLWLLQLRRDLNVDSNQPQYWHASTHPRLYLGATLLALIAAFFACVSAQESLAWHSDQALFSQALKRDPHYVEGQLGLADLCLSEERYAESVTHVESAIRDAQDDGHTTYWSPLVAYTNLGLALFHLERFDESSAAFDQAIAIAPQLATSHYHAGMADLARNRIEPARLHFLQAHELQPNYREATGNLALTYLLQGDAQRCVELLEPLMKQPPVLLTDRRNLGSAWLVLEDFDAASKQFKRIVQAEPDNAVDRAKFAWALAGSGRMSEAEEELDRALRIAPNDPVVQSVKSIIDQIP